MRTCWFTSGTQPQRTCCRRSRKRIRQRISVSDIVAFAFAANGLLLERRLDEERLQFEAKRREREEQHLFLTAKVKHALSSPEACYIFCIQVITDETFSHHEGFDLASFDEKNWPPSELSTFRVLKTETYNVFKARVAQHFNYPENQIRLWVLVNRQNKTVRPDTHIPENEPTLSVLCRT